MSQAKGKADIDKWVEEGLTSLLFKDKEQRLPLFRYI